MGELVIQYHNFENAKKELKKFSEQTTTDLDLKRVDDSKGVGEFLGDWFWGRGIGLDHRVTGEELNELTSEIQTHLCSINNTQIKLIREFGQVYSALEALDKDYIQAILISIKQTEATSESIKETQGQIKRIVENQRRTLEELKKFKQKLDGYAHLGDIDKIWSDCQKWYTEINTLSKSIDDATESSQESIKKTDAVRVALTTAEKKIAGLSQQTHSLIERLESIITFTTALEQVTHLKDIDEMWESLSTIHDSIDSLSGEVRAAQKNISSNQECIDSLLIFMKRLFALNHLTEVDEIWTRLEESQLRIKKVEQTDANHQEKLNELAQADEKICKSIDLYARDINNLKEYNAKLSRFSHLEDIDSIWQTTQKHIAQLAESAKKEQELASTIQYSKDEADKKLEYVLQTTHTAVESLTKKIKYAYLIAGGSMGLAIIELVLFLMKVI